MNIDPSHAAGFPSPQLLGQFFQMDRRETVDLALAADLFAMTPAQAQSFLRHEVPTTDGGIPWTEVAFQLFQLWSRQGLIDALGSASGMLPPESLPRRTVWQVPIYVARAMEHQARHALERDERFRRKALPPHSYARGVDDYVSELLDLHIKDETVEAFRHDPAFMAAYEYP
jgi:hypothetical protein